MPSEKEIEASARALCLSLLGKDYYPSMGVDTALSYRTAVKAALEAAEAVRLATPPASVDVQEVGVV